MGYDIKSIRKQFSERGVFYTDTKLAEILRGLITVDYNEVYDPTCGMVLCFQFSRMKSLNTDRK